MNTQNEKPLHVIELRAENIKRLKAITIRPDGAMVIIGGRNAQGKTSTLDALEMALAGGRAIPTEPVRRGERKGRIVVDLGEIVVERTFNAKGSALTVTSKDGTPVASPQKLLDTLCSKVAFDPLAFARMEPKQQDAILKGALGLDFSDIEAARAQLYTERADKNRDVKRLEALHGSTVAHHGMPAEELSVSDLMSTLELRQEMADEATHKRAALCKVHNFVDDSRKEIERLKSLLALAEDELVGHVATSAALTDLAAIAESLSAQNPIAEVRDQLRTAEDVNRKVRENAKRAEVLTQINGASKSAAALSEAIISLDAEKAERLASAKFPIPGLGFDETGPTLNGLPLDQASGAERLRVSVAIGAALNPRCKVMLVRDGSLLDDESMRLLAELAIETDSQLWVERVMDGDPSAIIIEDGEVQGQESENATAAE